MSIYRVTLKVFVYDDVASIEDFTEAEVGMFNVSNKEHMEAQVEKVELISEGDKP